MSTTAPCESRLAPSADAVTRTRPRVLQRCACGGKKGPSGECAACRKKRLARKRVQPSLRVGAPDDVYEREADRIADAVMRAPAHAAPLAAPVGVQRVGEGGAGVEAPASVDAVLASSGQPLDAGTRSFMEARMGHNFSHVRIHTDAAAAASAKDVHARAYTVGRDVAFGTGEYAPDTDAGRRLLAHELTHVVQQSGPVGGTLQRKETAAPTPRQVGDGVRRSPSGGVPISSGSLTWTLRYVGTQNRVIESDPSSNAPLTFTTGASDVEMTAAFNMTPSYRGCPTATFLQTVASTTGGQPDKPHLLFTRDAASGASADTFAQETEPYYGAGVQTGRDGLGPELRATLAGTAQPGRTATFSDGPMWSTSAIPRGEVAVRQFELAVICVETGATFGSVRWGYTKTHDAAITLTGGQPSDVRATSASPQVEAVRQAFYTGTFQHSLGGFIRGSATLPRSHRATLDTLAARGRRVRTITLVGSNDFSGGPEDAAELSRRRAESARDYLVAQGVPSAKILVEGHGVTARQPNPRGVRVAANRRVDVRVAYGNVGGTVYDAGSPYDEYRIRHQDPRATVREFVELLTTLRTRRGRLAAGDCQRLQTLAFYAGRWRRIDPTVPDLSTIYAAPIRAIRARCRPSFPMPRPQIQDRGPLNRLEDMEPDFRGRILRDAERLDR